MKHIHHTPRFAPADRPHGGPHRRGRPFDHGELRLLILAMIAETPRHGYEIIKAIEDAFGGGYSPSPGTVYPILAWLDDMGFVSIETGASGRKTYTLSPPGAAFLEENRAEADALRQRLIAPGQRGGVPAPVVRGMENVKLALRLRLRQGAEAETIARIAAVLDAAARDIEALA